MPVPDPADLILVSRGLADSRVAPPSDGQLRRAVSTAYYALFHKVVRAAASRFMGPGRDTSAGYRLLYRSFDHHHMKTMCEALAASTLKDRVKRQLGREAVSQDMREFANIFQVLQESRHLADYDPGAAFMPLQVGALIDAAGVAMADFERVDADERADVLALMMVRTRG